MRVRIVGSVAEFTARARHAQRLLTGAILQSPGVLAELHEQLGLRTEWFFGDHRPIVEGAFRLLDEGRAIDAFAVAEVSGLGVEFVRGAADRPAPHQDPLEYARVVRDESRWRAREDRAYRLAESIAGRDEELYERAFAESAVDGSAESEVLSADEFGAEMMRFLEDGGPPGIQLPYRELTAALNGGLMPGDTTVLSGYSSHGKSVLGVEVLSVAVRGGASGCLYTNELTRHEVGLRLVAGDTGISYATLRSREFSQDQHDRIVASLSRMPFPIAEAFGWKVSDLTREMRRRRWDVMVVDLFNRMPGRKSTQDVDEIITLLCDAAATTGTHLVLVAQLAKPSGKEKIPPPPTGDMLRESGALYTHPANLLFVYRKSREREDGRVVRQAEGFLYFDKVRNGSTEARVDVYLDERRMRFVQSTLGASS